MRLHLKIMGTVGKKTEREANLLRSYSSCLEMRAAIISLLPVYLFNHGPQRNTHFKLIFTDFTVVTLKFAVFKNVRLCTFIDEGLRNVWAKISHLYFRGRGMSGEEVIWNRNKN